MTDPYLRLPLGTWRSLITQVDFVYEAPIAPASMRLDIDLRHQQRAWRLLAGTVTVRSPSGTLRATAGDWLITPNERAVVVFSADTTLRSIAWQCHWPDGRPLFRESAGMVLPASSVPRFDLISRQLLKAVRRGPWQHGIDHLRQPADLIETWKIQTAELAWLSVWSQSVLAQGRTFARTHVDDVRLEAAVRIMDASALNEPWPAQRLREATGLSASQIDRLWLEHFQLTPRRYHDGRRLHRARQLLLGTSEPVKAIAFALGFRQASHFSQWFSQAIGRSPAAFRACQGHT